MPAAVSLVFKILASPLWLLWRFYGVLWWAFNEDAPSAPAVVPNAPAAAPSDSPPGPSTQRAAQDAAFEIVDSRPAPVPASKPIGALKGGFAASLAGGMVLAWLLNYAAGHEVIRPSSQLPLWLWSFCMLFVGSLWPVRHIARRQQAAQSAGWRSQVVCVAGGMKDCGVSAFAGARRAKDISVTAGKRVHGVAARVGDGAKGLLQKVHRRTA